MNHVLAFPGEDSSSLVVRSEERDCVNTSSDSLAVNIPAPQDEHVYAEEMLPPEPAPAQTHTEASDKPTLSPQQLHDRDLSIENAWGSNTSAMRGLTSTIGGFEPAPEPRIEERRNLTIDELERRRRIPEEPVQKS